MSILSLGSHIENTQMFNKRWSQCTVNAFMKFSLFPKSSCVPFISNQLIVLAFAVFADTQFVQTFNLLFVNDSLLKSQTDVPDCSLWTSGVRIGHLNKTSHSVQYVLLVWTTAILTVYLICSINNHLQNYFLSVSTNIFQFEKKAQI